MMSRILPAPPDAPDHRVPVMGGNLPLDSRRVINNWVYYLLERGIDPRSVEWPGWGYVPTENLASDIDLNRLLFYRWLSETGAIGEWTVTS